MSLQASAPTWAPSASSVAETPVSGWRQAGAISISALVTGTAANTFPQLPVREGEPVLVWLAAFTDPEAVDAARPLFPEQSIQRLRLEPTARSRLHG